MPNLRPELLRRFYESCWQGGMTPEQLYDGVSFDEYYALERVRYPQISRNTAAKNAPFDAFRALASTYSPEARPEVPALCNTHLSRRTALDLRNEAIDPHTERLVLDRIQSVTGWDALARFTRLHALVAILSGADTPAVPLPRAEVESVEILDCTLPCLRTILRSTSCGSLRFSAPDEIVNLSFLDGHTHLRELAAGASLLRGMERLMKWPLTSLDAGMVEVDDALRTGVAAQAGSLTRLAISSASPFSPQMLPELDRFSKLGRVEVSIYEMAFCEEWIAYAMAHPAIDFVFLRIVEDGKARGASLQEVYRGFDILRVGQGKTAVYEVSGEMAAELGAENNSDVEEHLQRIAAKAHQPLFWSSESGTFVAQATDVTICRWLIDEIHRLTDGSH
ncbi:MAG: hypothetical protein WCA21_17790 [Terracidiphilus sp.]